MHLNADVEIESEYDSDLLIDFIKSLVLWNDHFNTFDHVIDCLIKYAGKDASEASNIAFIVHTKGKCVILEGSKADIIECYNILRFKKLTVSIE
jgi:ATP-dependent Clp protease adaptor protein ClpS